MSWQAKTFFTCDRCGTTLNKDGHPPIPNDWSRLTLSFADPDKDIVSDLCGDCTEALIALAEARSDTPTDEEAA